MTATPLPAHSDIVGGSSAARVLACPGSIDMSRMVPEQPGSEYAEEGTALHEAMEYLLDKGCTDPDAVLGMVFNEYEMTRTLINECLEPALAQVDIVFDSLDDPDLEFWLEHRCEFPGIDGAFGSVDVIYWSPKLRLMGVIDYKFGGGVPVVAQDPLVKPEPGGHKHLNKQGLFYLAAADNTLDLGAERFEMHFFQPRLDYFGAAEVKRPQLDSFVADLKHAVAYRDDEKVYPLTIGSHCRWCPAKAICPAHIGDVGRAVEIGITARDLPKLLILAEKAKDWAKAVDAMAFDVLNAGEPVQGWKLVEGRSSYGWADDKRAERWLARQGLKVKDYRKPASTISPAQAEKLVGKKRDAFPADLVVKTPGKPTLAPENDKRPAIVTGKTAQEGVAAAIRRMKD